MDTQTSLVTAEQFSFIPTRLSLGFSERNLKNFPYDGLGSVRQLSNGGENLYLTQTYDPYGTVYTNAGSGASSFGWTGEQVDDNGLVYLRARYYRPGMGRFLNADPSRQEANPYQYAHSSPVNYVDPSGKYRLTAGLPGGKLFPGTREHKAIQNHWMRSRSHVRHVEYRIPGTLRRVDMITQVTGEFYEIKPNTPTGISSGATRIYQYSTLLNAALAQNHPGLKGIANFHQYDFSNVPSFSAGAKAFSTKTPIALNLWKGGYILYAQRRSRGLIVYWYEKRHQNQTVLNNLPSYTWWFYPSWEQPSNAAMSPMPAPVNQPLGNGLPAYEPNYTPGLTIIDALGISAGTAHALQSLSTSANCSPATSGTSGTFFLLPGFYYLYDQTIGPTYADPVPS